MIITPQWSLYNCSWSNKLEFGLVYLFLTKEISTKKKKIMFILPRTTQLSEKTLPDVHCITLTLNNSAIETKHLYSQVLFVSPWHQSPSEFNSSALQIKSLCFRRASTSPSPSQPTHVCFSYFLLIGNWFDSAAGWMLFTLKRWVWTTNEINWWIFWRTF